MHNMYFNVILFVSIDAAL